MRWKIFIVAAVLLTSIFLFVKYYPNQKTGEKSFVLVTKVIDGDTVELASGKKVRLIGIDGPEEGQPLFLGSKNFLRNLVENKEVILEKDSTNADQYGRLLRYIYVNGTFVNLLMIKEGYAALYLFTGSEKFSSEFSDAEKLARENKIGIWKTSEFHDCIEIKSFHYNAKGDDSKNLNDEYVIFVNACSNEIDLNNWAVSDKSNNVLTFSKIRLPANAELKLLSGKGNNTQREIYWHSDFAIWNNKEDSLFLRDSVGNLVLSKSYSN